MTRKYRQAGSVWVRQLNISRHLLCFCFFNIVFSCFFSEYYYLARDSSKKWQEIIDEQGLTAKWFTNFSSLFCFCSFFFFSSSFDEPKVCQSKQLNISRHFFVFSFFISSSFGEPGSSQIRQLKLSRHYFVFVFRFFSFFFLLSILLPCAG